MKKSLCILFLSNLALLPQIAQGGENLEQLKSIQSIPSSSNSIKEAFAHMWSRPTIYEAPNSSFIKKIRLVGRYHGQYYSLDSNQGNDDAWDHRRWRFGTSIQMAQDLTFLGQVNLNINDGFRGRFIKNLDLAFLRWTPSPDFQAEIGRVKALVNREYRDSSRQIQTIERSLLVNQLIPDFLGGGQMKKKLADSWELELGAYSGSRDSDWRYPTFDAGLATFFSLAKLMDEKSEIRFSWLWQDANKGNNALKPYDNTISLSGRHLSDGAGIDWEALYANEDSDGGELYGGMLMPWYDLVEDKLRLVFRYQIAGASDSDGLSLQSRYERKAPDLNAPRGDLYQAVYLGLNYFIYGDKLKLMCGAEWSQMDTGNEDYESITAMTAIRFYF